MKHLAVAGGVFFLCSQFAAASITNWSFDDSKRYQPSDSISFSYTSDRDTTVTRIYVETAGASKVLDTATDKLLFTIMMVDNNTDEKWGEEKGLMADLDPDAGAFLFSPGRAGLAPGLYLAVISDGASTVSDTFRVTALENPVRTVSGTVTPPEGKAASFINVSLEGKDMDYTLSSWTDDNGGYSIGVDQQTLDATGGEVRIRIDNRLEGYISEPQEITADLSSGNKTDANFSFVQAECRITGRVKSGDAVLSDVRVGVQNTSTNAYFSTGTDESGVYHVYCRPGTYRVRAEIDMRNSGYLSPMETKVEIASGETKTVDISVPKADAWIYARVTVKGSASTDTFAVSAWNEQVGGNRRVTDANGYVAIPVLQSAGKYGVSLEKSDEYPLPHGLIVENGTNWMEVAVGDTAYFNLVDKPSGGIGGSIENATSYTVNKIFIRVYSADSTGRGYSFETTQGGAYTFDGIPAGTYYAEAGMSVAGGDEWQWKVYQRYADSTGTAKQIVVGTAVVTGINWKFTANDTAMKPPVEEQKGTATLNLTVNKTFDASVEKGMVSLLEKIPMQGEYVQPLRTYTVTGIDSTLVLGEVPNRKLFVVVELAGKSGETYSMYRSFAKNGDGSPYLLRFDSIAVLDLSMTLDENDRVVDSSGGNAKAFGNGTISGTVSYSGSLPKDKLYALLYTMDHDDVIRGVSPDNSGSYVFNNIPVGKYRVCAAIDTNGDREPEAFVASDTVFTVSGQEKFENVALTLVDRSAGSGTISGTVSGFSTLSDKAVIVLSAIPVDTVKPLADQLSMMGFMSGYHAKIDKPGTYSIGMLPKGSYLVVALAKLPGDSSDNQEGIGMYGTLRTDSLSDMPFTPMIVTIADGQNAENIAITMIEDRKEANSAVVTDQKADRPAGYAFTDAYPVSGGQGIVLRFALPENAMVAFSLYDIRGRLVVRYAPEMIHAGYHTKNILTDNGRTAVAAGSYILQMRTAWYRKGRLVKLVR